MKLSHRPAKFDDFEEFYHALYRRDPALHDILVHEWRIFLAQSPDLTMVVEDRARAAGDRMVGIAQTIFVTDAFVDYVKTCLPYHVNVAASWPMPDGSPPLLTVEQICAANSGTGLNALTARWGWRNDPLDLEETREVRSYMDRTYPLFYLGYRYKYLLIPAWGIWPCERLQYSGFSLLTDYAEYFRAHPPTPPPHDRPYLLHACKSESMEGSYVNRIFDYTPPQFFFKPHEQELLWASLLGYTEHETAERLFIGTEALKKRWESIYDRVRDADPDLIPSGGDGTRGPEKRRRLLAYLRDHLEEVRPYKAPGS
jgi:hypothetical protein